MNWFYKLKRQVRIIITVVMWVLLFVVAGLIGNSMGENEEIKGWQAIIILLLLAVATAVTVFTIIARSKEVKATKIAKQAEEEKIAKAKTEIAQSEKTSKTNELLQNDDLLSDGIKLNHDDDLSIFSDTPDTVVTLIRNRGEEIQSEIEQCNVGDDVTISYDYESGLYLCSADSWNIGYLPEKVGDTLQGKLHIEIDSIKENSEGIYSVKVAIYKPINKIHFPIRTKVVGVSFDDRQDCIKASKEHDTLTIKHSPLAKYPEASLIINDRTGKTLGSVRKELAQDLLDNLGKGFVLCGEVDEITGGSDGKEYVGCNIIIKNIKQ